MQAPETSVEASSRSIAALYTAFNAFMRDYERPFEMPERLREAIAADRAKEQEQEQEPARRAAVGGAQAGGLAGGEPQGDDAGDGAGDGAGSGAGDSAGSTVVRKRYFRCMQNRTEVYRMVTGAMKRVRAICNARRCLWLCRVGLFGDTSVLRCFRVQLDPENWQELSNVMDPALRMCFNFLWTWSRPKIQYSTLLAWQRVNHFPNNKELTRKDYLRNNLRRYQCIGGRLAAAFELCPPTFVLPKEYLAFTEAFARGSDSCVVVEAVCVGGVGGVGCVRLVVLERHATEWGLVFAQAVLCVTSGRGGAQHAQVRHVPVWTHWRGCICVQPPAQGGGFNLGDGAGHEHSEGRWR